MPPASNQPIAAAIIVAAGRGTRLGAADKILLSLAGRPVLSYSIDAAESAASIADIIVVAGLHTKAQTERLVADSGWKKVRHVALGGDRRQDSVEAGLRLVSKDVEIVAVHDGARPLVTPELFDACVEAAVESRAAIAAVPLTDTLKRVDSGRIVETLPRDNVWSAQTPQAFETQLLRESFSYAMSHNLEVTDEASLMEAMGIPVTIVPSTPRNMKITRPEDLRVAEALLSVAQRGRAQ
jgi:2-C-methyl-D-erythritol 4-phosphate cytidylyltransferase